MSKVKPTRRYAQPDNALHVKELKSRLSGNMEDSNLIANKQVFQNSLRQAKMYTMGGLNPKQTQVDEKILVNLYNASEQFYNTLILLTGQIKHLSRTDINDEIRWDKLFTSYVSFKAIMSSWIKSTQLRSMQVIKVEISKVTNAFINLIYAINKYANDYDDEEKLSKEITSYLNQINDFLLSLGSDVSKYEIQLNGMNRGRGVGGVPVGGPGGGGPGGGGPGGGSDDDYGGEYYWGMPPGSFDLDDYDGYSQTSTLGSHAFDSDDDDDDDGTQPDERGSAFDALRNEVESQLVPINKSNTSMDQYLDPEDLDYDPDHSHGSFGPFNPELKDLEQTMKEKLEDGEEEEEVVRDYEREVKEMNPGLGMDRDENEEDVNTLREQDLRKQTKDARELDHSHEPKHVVGQNAELMKHQINDKRKPVPLNDDGGLNLTDVVKTQRKLLNDGNLNITPEYQSYIIEKPQNVQNLSQHYKGVVNGINSRIFQQQETERQMEERSIKTRSMKGKGKKK